MATNKVPGKYCHYIGGLSIYSCPYSFELHGLHSVVYNPGQKNYRTMQQQRNGYYSTSTEIPFTNPA